MPTFVFLDTNIYVHYKDFEAIDWCAEVGAHSVAIVVPPVTGGELNELKDRPSAPRRVKERAARAIKVLSGLFKDECEAANLQDGVRIILEPRDPGIDFEAHQLVRSIQDDHLIASMIAWRAEHCEAELVLVTADTGLHLRGKAHKERFRTISLPDSMKLADEVDPIVADNRKLHRQLQEATARLPRLRLEFADKEAHQKFVVSPPRSLDRERVTREVELARSKLPKLGEQPALPEHVKADPLFKAMAVAMKDQKMQLFSISEAQISAYNKQLDEHFQALKLHLENAEGLEVLKTRTIKLVLYLANDGTIPGKDMDIIIHFPDGFLLVEEEKLPRLPKTPVPPERPKSKLESMAEVTRMSQTPHIHNLLNQPSRVMPDTRVPNVSKPSVVKTKSFEVNFHVGSVKHGMREELAPLFAIFRPTDPVKPFAIDYKILAANVPEPVCGTLHVVVESSCEQRTGDVKE